MTTKITIKDLLPDQVDKLIDKIIMDMWNDGMYDSYTGRYKILSDALYDDRLRDYIYEKLEAQFHLDIRCNDCGELY